MSIPSFLRFDPAPVRARHDGWTIARQLRFVLEIARGAGPAEAARSVGMSRQTAYALRAKAGAEDFARAWDEAAAFARAAAGAGRKAGAVPGPVDTIWTPRYYRGRLVGFVAREELAAPMRVLARLDRLAERLGQSRIDELRAVSEALGELETDKADAIGPAKPSALSALTGSRAHPIFTRRR